MISKKEIINIIEIFIAWNGETDIIDIANIDSAVDFISNCLQEEPVSEDLEKVSEAYVLDDYIKPWRELVKKAFKAGAKWQKEQMMAKAIDAEVLENYDGKVIKYDETILDEKLSDCKVFDKIKLIMLKEN